MIEFVSGDLLRAREQYIAQGVATGSQEGLGTGLALKISSRWPHAQKKFKKHTRSNSFEGGDLFVVRPEDGQPGIIYIATQPDMYHATLSFVTKGLRSLALYCARNAVESVALPKIGCGLGKLDWSDVRPLMESYLGPGETLFRVYEDFKLDYEAR